MNKILVEIRGNRYTEEEIDNMLFDYINIGENVFKKRATVVDTLITNFSKKYKKHGLNIIGKKRNLKQFLNSAKLMYKLAEFSLCNNPESYDKYVYMLRKNDKGSKVYLHLQNEKELVIIYNSVISFLENWFIYKNILSTKINNR